MEEAQNGAEAVQKARSQPPHLIVLDLAMPVLDGREAMRLLASDPATAQVPVLAMSTETSSFCAVGSPCASQVPEPLPEP